MLYSKLRGYSEEQTKTVEQLQQSLSEQAQRAQISIADATQVAMKTAKDVQTLSDTARKAEYTAQVTAAKVEEQVAQLEQRLQEQKDMTIREAQAVQEAQRKMMQQLEEAQKRAQSTMGATQDYEAQIAAVSTQMKALEHLLVEQRMKGNSLENQLSVAQDRIGGAERRAQQLEEENRQIESELQYWNDYYAQEEEEEVTAEVKSAPEIGNPTAVSVPSVPMPIGESSAANRPLSDSTSSFPTWPAPIMSSPSLGFGFAAPTPLFGERIQTAGPLRSFDVPIDTTSAELPPPLPLQQQNRRESFGSTFAGSSAARGNGSGNGRGLIRYCSTNDAYYLHPMFKMEIKPKEPPIFRGTANEDVDSYLAKVEDFHLFN